MGALAAAGFATGSELVALVLNISSSESESTPNNPAFELATGAAAAATGALVVEAAGFAPNSKSSSESESAPNNPP